MQLGSLIHLLPPLHSNHQPSLHQPLITQNPIPTIRLPQTRPKHPSSDPRQLTPPPPPPPPIRSAAAAGGVAWTMLKALGESPCIQRNFSFFFFSLNRNTGAASFRRCPFTGVRIQPPQPREMMVTCLYMPASYFAYIMRLLRTGSLNPALSISHHNVILHGCFSSFPFACKIVYLGVLVYLFDFCLSVLFFEVLLFFSCFFVSNEFSLFFLM